MKELIRQLEGVKGEEVEKKVRKGKKIQDMITLELNERQSVEAMFGLSPALILSESHVINQT
jgi:hypothetical protein